MKYLPIDKELFIENRKRLADKVLPKSLAVFNSNDLITTGADSTTPFHQHRDIFYLSGVDQQESILVIFPDCSEKLHREILFLKETNEHIAVWEGEKLDKQAAFDTSGIRTVYWLQDFEKIFLSLVAEAENIYLNTNEHLRASTVGETRDDRFRKECMDKYPLHNYKRLSPIMHYLRSIKSPIEIDLIQRACDITEKGFRRLLKFVKPGVMEYEVEAELLHEFVRNRSRGFAYTPIIGSGKNACVLHYIENNQKCKDGDLLLLDTAAEYANYASDMTRTIPINGKFNSRQKAVYDSVLHVKEQAEKLLVPGNMIKDYHVEVGKLMEAELLNLKLIDKNDIKNQSPDWPAYKKYFMHGTSHYIGLDTHDVGLYHIPIEPNMVFTVEPGIYIPNEGIGIRIEDNLVVQEKGTPVNLMEKIPISTQEIEEVMNS